MAAYSGASLILALLLLVFARSHDHSLHHIHELEDWAFDTLPAPSASEGSIGSRRRLEPGSAYTLIGRLETECELEALTVGSMLADRYNSLDEATEWDVRIHNDFLTEHLGFAGWIQQGTWGSKAFAFTMVQNVMRGVRLEGKSTCTNSASSKRSRCSI
jgi:hypothetical protein